jgi:hypothetical protein
MRGQADNYSGMVPGLFRPPCNGIDSNVLLNAEARFEAEIRKMGPDRMRRPHLAALLQHYGYRTSWLDVVDNLWVAVWFATHSIGPGDQRERTASARTHGSGWLYFIACAAGSSEFTAIDLRSAHHDLSLRPHTQHGWSVRGASHMASDINDCVIACVEFPIDDRWMLDGHLGSSEFLFPPVNLDNTLRRLLDRDVDNTALRIAQEFGLPPAALGRLYYLNGQKAETPA